ncbi:PREDICTED: brain-specific angiogenesis inhibitor 1-associated protein 2-like protein 1 [Poecilia mexicana]|nr:PREDICTED: brain-specific angiogenesis inhibitor 1-associated protein 2-like protein 1 [Poecilia mexicana]
MVLPLTDYYNIRSKPLSTVSVATNNHQHSPTPSAASSTSSDQNAAAQSNGTSRPPPAFLAGGNPFATVRLRPTVTNDRSAPVI